MERRSTRAKKNVDPVTAVDGHTAVDQAKQPLNTVPSPSTTRRTQQASASRSKPIDSISGSASSTVHGTSAKLQAGDPTSVSAGATADANRPTATKKRRNASTSQSTSTKKPRSMKTSVDTASKTSPSTGEIAPPSKEQNSSDDDDDAAVAKLLVRQVKHESESTNATKGNESQALPQGKSSKVPQVPRSLATASSEVNGPGAKPPAKRTRAKARGTVEQ